MAELQQGRGPCGEHLMQKCLGVSGTHMLPQYVLSGRAGNRWRRWREPGGPTGRRPLRGPAREKLRAGREGTARRRFLPNETKRNKTKNTLLRRPERESSIESRRFNQKSYGLTI